MRLENYLRIVARILRNHASYKPTKNGWTLSLSHVQDIFELHIKKLPPEADSLGEMLEAGVREGFWIMDYDPERETDVIVIP